MEKYLNKKYFNRKNITIAYLAGLSAYIVLTIFGKIRKFLRRRELLKLKAEYDTMLDGKINAILPQLKEISPELENEISFASLSELREGLKTQKFTSLDLVTVFIKRTCKYGRSYGWIADVAFSEALETARKCDEVIKQALQNNTFDSLPLVFGIPFSAKDHVKVKGLITSYGLLHKVNNKDDCDAEVVAILRENGAIPFMKTTVPFLTMSIHGHSHLWGEVRNPWDRTKITGGSSSGEGGMIAAGCSPFGIGSDAAGSLRIPSSFCGISSIMPTVGRVSLVNSFGNITRQMKIPTSHFNLGLGVMAKSPEDVNFVHKVLNSERTLKRYRHLAYVPWRVDIASSREKLKIGYVMTDGIVEPCETVKRALNTSIEILRKLGHEVVEFKVRNSIYTDIYSSFWKIFGQDQGKLIQELVEDENFDVYFTENKLHRSSKFTIKSLRKLLNLLGEKRTAFAINHELTGEESLRESILLRELKEYFLGEMNSQGLDALLTPSLPFPAPSLEKAHDGSLGLTYCTLFNYLCMPSGVTPVTFVRKEETQYVDSENKDTLAKFMTKTVASGEGLPIAVQVASYPFNDELIIRILKEIYENVNFPHRDVTHKLK